MVFFSPQGEPLLNPYLVLEIEFGACDDDIGKAYKKLMLHLHPDKQPTDQSKEEAEEISKRFHDVMGAKSFLLDGEYLASRREYDARLIAKKKANAAAAAQETTQQTARAKAQQKKQQQSAPSVPQSPSGKVHHSVTKAATKSASNKGDHHKADVNNKTDTYKKPHINKKQWGRVSRPSRLKNTSEPTKVERGSSCSTTSEDSSSDDEGPHSGRIKNRKMTKSNDKLKSANVSRSKHHNKQKKSPSCSDKPCKDSSSKNTSHKRSHAISSKGKKTVGAGKSTSTKKTYNKGSNLADRKISNNKKESKTEKKQRSKSESAKHKLPTSCPSLFDDDKNGKNTSYAKKSSVGGRMQGSDKTSEATSSWVPSPTKQPKSTTLNSSASPKAHAPSTSSFDTFQPAVETLTKQYLCPLTKEVMNEPMTDFEGNSYERSVILKYLETHSTSPVTGNALCPLHLTANSGLKERIQYTLKLKSCIDALSSQEKSSSTSGLVMNETSAKTSQQCHSKPLTLRQSVDMFIKELNSTSANVIITRLDSSGKASFTYNGLDYTLQVPEGLSHNIIVQTWFDQDRKAAGISSRIVE